MKQIKITSLYIKQLVAN